MSPDPKSIKKTDGLTVFFALLGSAQVKAALKMLMTLTSTFNFNNILRAASELVFFVKKITNPNCKLKKLRLKCW